MGIEEEYIQCNRLFVDLCLITDFHNKIKIFSHPVFICNCTVILFFRMSGFWFFNYFYFNSNNYLIFNVLKIFLYIFDIEIHTNVFMRHKTPLKQVRFKKIPPWFAFEPSLVRAWTKLGWNSNQGTILRKQAWFKGGVCSML